MKITNMNQAYDLGNNGNMTLLVDGEVWGVVNEARVKYGNEVIQWLIDDCTRIFNVDNDKLYRMNIELV